MEKELVLMVTEVLLARPMKLQSLGNLGWGRAWGCLEPWLVRGEALAPPPELLRLPECL